MLLSSEENNNAQVMRRERRVHKDPLVLNRTNRAISANGFFKP